MPATRFPSDLTPEEVRNLRVRAVRGETYCALAMAFGLVHTSARKIARGLARKDILGPVVETDRTRPGLKLTEFQVTEIRIRASDGVSFDTLARDYGVSHWTIRDVVSGKCWKSAPGPIDSSLRKWVEV